MRPTGPESIDNDKPINLTGRAFNENKYEHYRRLLETAPVSKGRIALIKLQLLSRHEDCMELCRDPRFVRNRTTATGGSRMPFPMPRSVSFLVESMIQQDGDDHRRLRGLVNKAFTPRAVAGLAGRIEALTHELLDSVQSQGPVDLIQAYAQPIPATVIAELVGVSKQHMPRFANSLTVLSKGLSGLNILRTLLWDLRGLVKFVRELIAEKRSNPGDDILTGLIQAEEEGDRLTEDELVATVFLLIVAGFETTTHLISNGVLTLLQHPEQLERLRAEPERMETAVEEILRHRGPVHGTKPQYATEDLSFRGVAVPKGSAVIPLLGAANHDPAVFEKPEVFDIARTPNRHLGFGFGEHYCLGAQLARMETGVALRTLLERSPNLRLAVDPAELKLQKLPLWHRYESLPVALG